MAFSFVQAQKVSVGSAATTWTVTISPTAGNLLVCLAENQASATATVTVKTTQSSTAFTAATAGMSKNTGAVIETEMFFLASAPSGQTSVTLTWSTGSKGGAIVAEFSGQAATPRDTDVNNNQSSQTTHTSGTYSTSQAGDLVVYGGRADGGLSITAGSPFTIPTNGLDTVGGFLEYNIFSGIVTNGTATVTTSNSVNNATCLMAFKAAAAGGAVVPVWNMPPFFQG